jgi:cyclic-di-GMP phosphodiesterase TipF (flagellum assembly factor)
MTAIWHLVIALSYALVAVALVVVVPQHFPAVGPDLALVIGGLALLAGALLHEVFWRFGRDTELVRHIRALHARQEEVVEELERARIEARNIHQALTQAGRMSGGTGNNLDEVVAEVRVLQGLVDQLWTRGEGKPQPTTPRAAPYTGNGVTPPTITLTREDDIEDAELLPIVREALGTGRVDLFLQPIVSLPQRKQRYFECFSRIRDTEDSVILPDRYIQMAEREGLITAIDNMLLFRCIQLIRKAQKQDATLRFFCNISRHTLADKTFLRDVAEFIRQNRELAPALVFEFSQADFDNIDPESWAYLERLAALGMCFSIDQVAAPALDGADLARRHVRFAKVEVSMLTANWDSDELDTVVLNLRNNLARHRIDLIAEKVETEKDLVELLEYNIDFGQGYLFGEPRVGSAD